MAKQVREYMDIGYDDPMDWLWFLNRDMLEIEIRRAAAGKTHEKEWHLHT